MSNKRSFNLVDSSSTITASKRRSTEKVGNSLKTDSSFPWPSSSATTNIMLGDRDDDTSDFGDDNFTAYGGSIRENDSDSDDDLLELLTELSQEQENFNSLDSMDSVDYSGDDVFLPHHGHGESHGHYAQEVNKNNIINSVTSTSPPAAMDQACSDYFMAEYMKFIASSSSEHTTISFPDFVAVSLDMIASFTKQSAATTTFQTQQVTKCENTSPTTTSFDFSIQNWQRRVLAEHRHDVNYQEQEQTQLYHKQEYNTNNTMPMMSQNQNQQGYWPSAGFMDEEEEFQFQIFDDDDTQHYAYCYSGAYSI